MRVAPLVASVGSSGLNFHPPLWACLNAAVSKVSLSS
jgi:hypothetical protein